MILQRWIRELPVSLAEMEVIPLLGTAPPYDWNAFASRMAEEWQLSSLQAKIASQEWKESAEIAAGLGNSPWIAALHVAPLDQVAFLALSRSDQEYLLSWVHEENFSSESLREGLTSFLLLQVLGIAAAIPPLDALSITLEKSADLPNSRLFSLEIEIKCQEKTLLAQLLLPKAFREAWVHHFANLPFSYRESALAQTLTLRVGLEIGKVTLSEREWKEVTIGDLLFLESASYDPEQGEGIALLKTENIALCQAQILRNRITVQPIQEEIVEEETPQSLETIPLTLSVELARLQLPLSRLAALQPGNLLELPLDPAKPVSLTLHGKLLAKGELVQIGNKVGLQITALVQEAPPSQESTSSIEDIQE
ncbi:MAG: type III secretion system cytoplasmic ring protein SctQ [Verrucomicrobiota bacterium]|nr:type III secretion system cytoplasmic ring protein SctQ [Verrucomicrobiota bacterium]